jgi:hypothetical protein
LVEKNPVSPDGSIVQHVRPFPLSMRQEIYFLMLKFMQEEEDKLLSDAREQMTTLLMQAGLLPQRLAWDGTPHAIPLDEMVC